MGGDARSLILPVPIGPRGVSSWAAHQERYPKSSEPGTDIYCDTGTEVLAPADGVIYSYGESVVPATGRWVGVDLDNGMSFRCMHHSRIVRKSGRVRQGDVIALSGSSGYGSEFFGEPSRNAAFWANTGGDHTHVTLWPTRDKRYGYGRDGDPSKPYTIDIMDFIRGGEDVAYADDKGLQERLDQIVEYMRANFEGLTALVKAESDEQIDAANAKIDEARDQLAGWTRDDANSLRAQVAAITTSGTDPRAVAAAVVALLPAGSDPNAILDALAARLKS